MKATSFKFANQKKSVAHQKALAYWHNPKSDFDKAITRLEKVFEKENDIYSMIEHHIFIHDNFLNNRKKFTAAVNKALGIRDSNKFMTEWFDKIESKYVDTRANIAFYLLLEKHTDMKYDTVDELTEKIAGLLN